MRFGKASRLLLGLIGLALLGACGDDRLFNVARLSEQGEEGVPELIELMDDQDWEVRREAAFALARIGPPARAAVPVLIAALGDEREGIRYFSALALGNIGSVAAVPGLTAVLQDDNRYVRGVAAESLGKIGEQTDAVVPVLIVTLAHTDESVRSVAAGALEKIGTPEALAALENYDGSILQHFHSTCPGEGAGAGKITGTLHICNNADNQDG